MGKISEFIPSSFPNHSIEVVVLSSATVLGCLFLKWVNSREKKKQKLKLEIKKRKPVVTPQWAITKAREMETPNLTEEGLKSLEERKPAHVWNSAIFFPDTSPKLRNSPTQQLKMYFREAKTSIYVCMYLCSLLEMSDLIKDKYSEGLVVQIVTDFDTWTAHNNKGFKILARRGLPVKVYHGNGCLMHNKFAIIDEEAVLTGSLNWTRQGSMTNSENVMITTNPKITSRYLREFNKLWREFKDVDEADR